MATVGKQATLILDTDHLSEMHRQSSAGAKLAARLEADPRIPGTTIVSAQEQLGGLLALVKRSKNIQQEIECYDELQKAIVGLSRLMILPWNAQAAANLSELRAARIRIGTMDLRIASIAIANHATLLSRNLKDFSRVPGLRVENWLE